MTVTPKDYKLNHFACQTANNGFIINLGFQNRKNADDVISETWVAKDRTEVRSMFEQWQIDVEVWR